MVTAVIDVIHCRGKDNHCLHAPIGGVRRCNKAAVRSTHQKRRRTPRAQVTVDNLASRSALTCPAEGPEHHVFLADVWDPSHSYSPETLTIPDKKSPNKLLERAVPSPSFQLPPTCQRFTSYSSLRGCGGASTSHKSGLQKMQSEQKNALVERLPTLTNETRAGRLCKKSRLGRKMHSTSLPLQFDISSECRPNCSTSARSLGPECCCSSSPSSHGSASAAQVSFP